MDAGGIAVVTGAGRGIGHGVALELAARGFDVLATVRDPAAGRSLVEEARERGVAGDVAVEQLDVTAPGGFHPPEGLRVLVNNAAVDTENRALEDTPLDEWRRVFDANVFGLVELTRRCLPAMRSSGGGVVCNISSAGLLVPMPFFSVYRASKAAVSAVGESLRAELAPFSIRVVEMLPGPIATDMLAASAVVPEGADDPVYAALAARVAEARGDIDAGATPVDDAASDIVDAICDDDAPLRCTCDPLGAAMLEGWRGSPDEEFAAGFLDAFRVDRAGGSDG